MRGSASSARAMALAAGERQTALADERLEAVGERLEQLPGPALGGRADLLVVGLGPGVGDVVTQAGREEKGVVRDDGHLAPQRSRSMVFTSAPSTSTAPC